MAKNVQIPQNLELDFFHRHTTLSYCMYVKLKNEPYHTVVILNGCFHTKIKFVLQLTVWISYVKLPSDLFVGLELKHRPDGAGLT
jgi:hypothetical protein